MSHQSITQATQDQALLDRVSAAVQKEAYANPTFGDTPFGEAVIVYPQLGSTHLIWPVAIDYEDEYAYAVSSNNPNPGADRGVITDENISAAVQAHWPQVWPPT
jgi:hypothetical protein